MWRGCEPLTNEPRSGLSRSNERPSEQSLINPLGARGNDARGAREAIPAVDGGG